MILHLSFSVASTAASGALISRTKTRLRGDYTSDIPEAKERRENDVDTRKLNPQHVIPTMDDNGFVLCESRPIMGYLASKYAKNDSLYPKDPKKRGMVDQMLYFDVGSLHENMIKCYYPVALHGAHSLNEEDVQAVEKSCELLNTYLENREFVAGDTLTIADFAIHTTICVLLCFDFDIGRYDNVAAWYNRCKQLLDKFGFEDVHGPGTKMFTELYQANLGKSS
ncbi:glutathione S-transferase D5-like isoform X1 [Bombus pyrosoma]|uniref:glutathione S-transferase D5-like isoform X1 n=1 Tax=Bombus pyrosoma TaxID=396416 RepID=UPI001CB9870F|nr:glutathione S-transferase D5-like isoform X1 [Bombus pyrosoma]